LFYIAKAKTNILISIDCNPTVEDSLRMYYYVILKNG